MLLALSACGLDDRTNRSFQQFSECPPEQYEVNGACGTCENVDGAYCAVDQYRQGACMFDTCAFCGEFVCGGVFGCSADPAFEHNGDGAGTCPAGCYSACAL
jgi:hypothetical protein